MIITNMQCTDSISLLFSSSSTDSAIDKICPVYMIAHDIRGSWRDVRLSWSRCEVATTAGFESAIARSPLRYTDSWTLRRFMNILCVS